MKKIEMKSSILEKHNSHWQNIQGERKIRALRDQYSNNTNIYNFLDYLYDNNEKIVLGTPKELAEIKQEISDQHINIFLSLATPSNQDDAIKKLKEELKKIFDYSNFSSFHVNAWDAYKYLKELNIAVCPYCERNFVTTFISDETNIPGRTRAQLDHFYSKSKYPYFAISIYNLIPSCYVCNSSFKGSKEFELTTHFHPYENELKNVGYFSFGDANLITDILSLNYSIKIKENNNINVSQKLQITNLKEIFFIEELYNTHKNYFDDFISYHKYYTEEYKNELKEILSIMNGNSDTLVEEILEKYKQKLIEQQNRHIQSNTLFSQAFKELSEILEGEHE